MFPHILRGEHTTAGVADGTTQGGWGTREEIQDRSYLEMRLLSDAQYQKVMQMLVKTVCTTLQPGIMPPLRERGDKRSDEVLACQ